MPLLPYGSPPPKWKNGLTANTIIPTSATAGILVKGHSSIGNNALIDSVAMLHPSLTFSSTLSLQEEVTSALGSFQYTTGLVNHLSLNPSANTANSVLGEDVEIVTKSTNTKNFSGTLQSMYFRVSHEGTGNTSNIVGVGGDVELHHGTLSGTLRGAFSSVDVESNAVVTGLATGYGSYMYHYSSGNVADARNYEARGLGSGTFTNYTAFYGWDQSSLTVSGNNRFINYADKFTVDAAGQLLATQAEVRNQAGNPSLLQLVGGDAEYNYMELNFYLRNTDFSNTIQHIFEFGAEGTLSDAGTITSHDFYIIDNAANGIGDGLAEYRLYVEGRTGNFGINGITAPTAKLHISAGTATAGTAPLKLTSGTALTTPENGALEYHSSHLYFTIGSTRYQLDQQGSGSPGGSDTQVQFNDGGAFGGDSGMTYNKTTDTLYIAGKLGIGTSSPSAKMHLTGPTGNQYITVDTAYPNPTITISGDTAAGYYPTLQFYTTGSPSYGGSIQGTPGGLAFNASGSGSSSFAATSASNRPIAVNATLNQTANIMGFVGYAGSALIDIGPSGKISTYGGRLIMGGNNPPTQGVPVASSGGSFAAGTYYWVATVKNSEGVETPISNERSLTVTAGQKVTLSASYAFNTGNCDKIRFYRSTVSGSYGASSLVGEALNIQIPSIEDTGAATTTGTPPASVSDGTAISVQAWQAQTNNPFQLLDSTGATLLATSAVGNFGIGTTTFGASMVGGVAVKNGTAPSGNVTDVFQMYSADITAGNAAPHFRTENGDVIKLYKTGTYTPTNVSADRSYDANATTLDEVADVLGTLIADLQLLGVIG